MDLDLVFLGTSGSAPTANRAPAALLVRRGGDRLLFDCAEGTQRQLMRSVVGLPDLEQIFISHFHADHYLGLPGMLKTFQLRQREVPLTVYGPPGLRDLFAGLRRVFGKLSYPLELVEVRPGEALERDGYRILVFPVHHGVSAVGYALDEHERPGRFDNDTADALGIPVGPERGALQRGESITLDDGRVLTPDVVLGDARPGRRIVIPGDTAPVETVRVLAEGADVLVHEATFSEEERDRAAETLHSTALQAAEVARDAGVRLLALTHVSPRYFGSELAEEAREVFPSTVVPRDFDVIAVPFAERGEPHLVKAGARPPRNAVPQPSEL
jgi:ribonuclease Z